MWKMIVGLVTVFALSLGVAGCDYNSSTNVGVRAQEKNMKQAMAQTPVPVMRNFLTRKTISAWLTRQDVLERPSYVYLFMMGNRTPIGYFAAKSRPVNVCTSITPPKREYDTRGQGANPLGPAPALDGVYYGGSGCNQWYFFDTETNALIEFTTGSGIAFFASDVPLELNVDVPKLGAKEKFVTK